MRYLLCLLFCLLAGVAQAAPANKAYMSIIIDDLGQSTERDSRTLALPGPVTMAIMPDTPHASDFARQAHKAGKTVILHMPMDPATGPYAWHPELPLPVLASRLDAALAKVPFAAGINNHMGSRMTAQREPMAWLMGELQQRHLFFVDSRTSAATVAAAEAQKIGLASLSRDVFLDDDPSEAAVLEQMQRGLALARKQGTVVMIGHPKPATLAVLKRVLPTLKAQGFELVKPSLMIAERGNRAMAGHGRDGIYR